LISRRTDPARSDVSKSVREGTLLLGRFEVTTLFAEDELGRLCEARDRRDGATVRVRLCSAQAPGAMALLSRTLRLSRRARLPSLCPVRACGRQGQTVVLVTDAVPGQALAERLACGEGWSLARARALACDLSSALALAHAHGIVHGGVRPESIRMVGERAVLCDLGVAQALSGCRMDERADVHGLGRVLYHALTGAPPFERPAELLPAELRASILRCLQRDPGRRFGSLVQAAAALGCPLPVPGHKGRRWKIAALALLVLVALVGLGATLRRDRAVPPPSQAVPLALAPVVVEPKKPLLAVAVSAPDPALALGLREAFAASLRESTAVDVLPTDVGEGSLVAAAWKSQVDVVLAVSVAKEGSGVRLELKLLDVETGALRYAERSEAGPEDELLRRLHGLLVSLGRALGSAAPSSALGTSNVAALRQHARGWLAWEDGDARAAQAAFREAAQLDRQFFAPRAALVRLLSDAGQGDQAKEALAEARPLAARAGAWGTLTARFLEATTPGARLESALALSQRFPHDASLALLLAGEKQATQDAQGCVTEARKALALDARLWSAQRQIALCSIESGDLDAALAQARAYAQAAEARGQGPRGQEFLGDVLLRRGRYADADLAFRRASEAGSASALAKRGLVQLWGRGKCQAAITTAKKAARTADTEDRAGTVARVWLVASLACGDGASAREAGGWLKRQLPASAGPGELALGQKDSFDEARRRALDETLWTRGERAWRFAPLFVVAHEGEKSAQALELLGSPVPADRVAFLWDPLLYHVALAKVDVGDPDEAELLCREVLAVAPGYVPGHYCLGRAAEAKKDFSRAFREYRAFLDAWSDGDDAHRLLGDARRRIKVVVRQAREPQATP
jgi:serine/threonine-protein kinase